MPDCLRELRSLSVHGAEDVTMRTPAVMEANALVRFVVHHHSHAGLAALKTTIFVTCLGISVYGARVERDAVFYYAPMVMLAVAGAITTAVNVTLLWG